MTDFRKLAYFVLDQLRRRRWTALLVAWAVCVTGWVAVAAMPDRYVSEARFHVDTSSLLTPLLKGIAVNSDDQSRDRQVAIMQRTLTSRPNLLKVTQMTDLDKTTRSDGALQDLLTSLESRISIKSQGTNLFLVQFTDNSPLLARNVVQALLTIFVDSSIGDKREDIKSARTFIDTQIDEYETQLKATEQHVADFKIQNIQYLSSSSQNFAMRMENAQDALKTTQFEYDDAVAQRDIQRRQLNATPQYLSVDAAPPAGSVVGGGSRQQRIRALQVRLDDLRLQFTEKHPDVTSVQQALNRLIAEQKRDNGADGGVSDDDAMRSRIPNELHSQLSLRLGEAEGRVGTARRKLAEARSGFETLQARASEAPRIEAEFTNLNRDYDVLRTSYEALLQRRESARIAAAADTAAEPIQFRLVAAPELPAQPAGPKRELFNTIVMILGVLAGGGFVVMLAKIDGRITAAEDLTDFTNSRVLGCVSALENEPRDTPSGWRIGRFGYAAAGLAVTFGLVMLWHPNLSALTRSIL